MNKPSRKKKTPFTPFANEADVATIGELMLENRVDRITISGDVDLTADQPGLERARRLHALLGQIVTALEARDLPAELPPPEVKIIDNPFA